MWLYKCCESFFSPILSTEHFRNKNEIVSIWSNYVSSEADTIEVGILERQKNQNKQPWKFCKIAPFLRHLRAWFLPQLPNQKIYSKVMTEPVFKNKTFLKSTTDLILYVNTSQ